MVDYEQRTKDAIQRALTISRRLAKRDDVRVRNDINSVHKVKFSLKNLCITRDAWNQIKQADIKPRLVFAHPEILRAVPQSSLHYRGSVTVQKNASRKLQVP